MITFTYGNNYALQIVRFAGYAQALVSGQDAVREELSTLVQELCDLMRVVPGTERADVQLEIRRHFRQELGCAWTKSCVVPGQIGIQLEVIHVLQIVRNAVICRVDQRLVQIDQQNELLVAQQPVRVRLAQFLRQLVGNFQLWHRVHHRNGSLGGFALERGNRNGINTIPGHI